MNIVESAENILERIDSKVFLNDLPKLEFNTESSHLSAKTANHEEQTFSSKLRQRYGTKPNFQPAINY